MLLDHKELQMPWSFCVSMYYQILFSSTYEFPLLSFHSEPFLSSVCYNQFTPPSIIKPVHDGLKLSIKIVFFCFIYCPFSYYSQWICTAKAKELHWSLWVCLTPYCAIILIFDSFGGTANVTCNGSWRSGLLNTLEGIGQFGRYFVELN